MFENSNVALCGRCMSNDATLVLHIPLTAYCLCNEWSISIEYLYIVALLLCYALRITALQSFSPLCPKTKKKKVYVSSGYFQVSWTAPRRFKHWVTLNKTEFRRHLATMMGVLRNLSEKRGMWRHYAFSTTMKSLSLRRTFCGMAMLMCCPFFATATGARSKRISSAVL